MKKESWLVVLLAVIGLAILPGIAAAQAVVIQDTSCIFLNMDGKTTFPVLGGAEDLNSIKVVTPSANCNRNVSCHTDINNLVGQAYVFDFDSPRNGTGYRCEVEFIYTDRNGVDFSYTLSTENWHEAITPKGKVSLTCHFKDCLPTECDPTSTSYYDCCLLNPLATGCGDTLPQ